MAIIKTTALISGIKGNMGGSSFYQSPYGNIMSLKGKRKRRKCYEALLAMGVDPQSAAHDCNQLGLTAGGWTGLTSQEKTQWNTLAQTITWFNRFGDTYQPSGYLVYMQYNLNLARAGIPRLDIPGTQVSAPVNFVTVFGTGGNGAPTFDVTTVGDLANFIVILTIFKQWPGFKEPPQGPAILPTNAQILRNGNGFEPIDPNLVLVPIDMGNFWTARYGSFPVDSQVLIGVNYTNKFTGQRFEGISKLHLWA